MRLFQWLFGGKSKVSDDKDEISPDTSTEIKPQTSSENLIDLTGSGKFPFSVVGESYYQDNLKQICGEYSIDGTNKILTAALIHADDNQYDSEAIRVEIFGKTVGHMSKADARMYRTYMRSKNWSGLTATCKAKITGGWDLGQEDIGQYGVSLDLPLDFIESLNSIDSSNLNEAVPSDPNTIIFNVERPHIRDFNEIDVSVKLWIPKEDPEDVFIFHRDGPDGRIGIVPYKYKDIIMSHILAGLEYDARTIELGFNKCKIKCRLISKDETEGAIRTELTKPYNPKKPFTLFFTLKKKSSAKKGDKLRIEFDELDSYLNGKWNLKFINQSGEIVGSGSDDKNTIRKILKAHFNSFLFDVEVLDIEKERDSYRKGYLTKLVITPYKAQ